MNLSRRTFLQSSLSAGIIAAANDTGKTWALDSHQQLRLGIASLSGAAQKHLALLAAIPAAQITAIADHDAGSLDLASAFLLSEGRARPAKFRDYRQMLYHSQPQAIVFPGYAFPSTAEFDATVAIGLPVLLDAPLALDRKRALAWLREQAGRFLTYHTRLADYLRPCTLSDITRWRSRIGASQLQVDFIVPSRLQDNCRNQLTAGVDAVLATSSLKDHELIDWISRSPFVSANRTRSVVTVVPIGATGSSAALRFQRSAWHTAPEIRLQSEGYQEKMTIYPSGRSLSGLSSISTVLAFLDSVRTGNKTTASEIIRSHVAGLIVDESIRTLQA
jgi:hypothetical protein